MTQIVKLKDHNDTLHSCWQLFEFWWMFSAYVARPQSSGGMQCTGTLSNQFEIFSKCRLVFVTALKRSAGNQEKTNVYTCLETAALIQNQVIKDSWSHSSRVFSEQRVVNVIHCSVPPALPRALTVEGARAVCLAQALSGTLGQLPVMHLGISWPYCWDPCRAWTGSMT